MTIFRTPRHFVALTVVAILSAVMLCAPSVSFAATPLAIGVSTTGTLAGSAGDYRAEFTVNLRKGQTLAATYTPAPGITHPQLWLRAPFNTDVGSLASERSAASTAPIGLHVLAPRSATYELLVTGQSVPGTFTIDSAIVPAFSYTLSPLTAPVHATSKRWFAVSCVLTGKFDQLNMPVSFIVQRKVSKTWRAYKTLKGAISGGMITSVRFRTNLKLPKGTFRVRARFADAAHPHARYNRWKTIYSDSRVLTQLPAGMTPKTALTKYLQAIQDKDYALAFSLLPPAQRHAYGSAKTFGDQVSSYGITGFKVGKPRAKGSTVTIVSQQNTPQMSITYKWTYVRVGGQWFVKSRAMGSGA